MEALEYDVVHDIDIEKPKQVQSICLVVQVVVIPEMFLLIHRNMSLLFWKNVHAM